MSAYNQSLNGQSVRIGNWFEELKLKEDTGIRFYAPPKTKSASMLTKQRCIDHTERVDPKNYTTVTRETLKDPRAHHTITEVRATVGPRQRRLEASLREEVNYELSQKADHEYAASRKVDYKTTGRSCFSKDGFKESLRINDPNARVNTRNSSYATDNAITYYSYALKNPDERVNFPASFVGSTNPFSKHNAFSADIANDTLARRTETNERPRTLPTLKEFKILKFLREKLLKEARGIVGSRNGVAMRYATDALLTFEEDWISLSELKSLISSKFSGLILTEEEQRALTVTYDYKSNGLLALPEFVMFLRPGPATRRGEIVEHFFNLLPEPQNLDQEDGMCLTVISCDKVRDYLKRSGLSPASDAYAEITLLLDTFGDSFTFDDFYNYYVDISAEMEDDYVFEECLRQVWENVLN